MITLSIVGTSERKTRENSNDKLCSTPNSLKIKKFLGKVHFKSINKSYLISSCYISHKLMVFYAINSTYSCPKKEEFNQKIACLSATFP